VHCNFISFLLDEVYQLIININIYQRRNRVGA